MNHRAKTTHLGLCYAGTTLLSAFLVFQVQPLISKTILPWFGGTPSVWTTCMLFFQVLLFAGYSYAHLSIRLFKPAAQGIVHLALIFASLSLLPVTPDPLWKPLDSANPTWRILSLLAANVGLPYFLLCSTAPLVQAWLSRDSEGRSPYRLYALSNFGSLLALISFPFVVEPTLSTNRQSDFWTLGFSLFALCSGYCALRVWKPRTPMAVEPSAESSPVGRRPPVGISRQALWLGLSACGSVSLLTVTQHVCQDVAVIPLLWVVPLSVYLVTFIICFERERWYSRRWFGLSSLLLIVATSATGLSDRPVPLAVEAGLYLLMLFSICMLCHGELVRLKPCPENLTAFYLMSAAGGAFGGILIGLAAPLLFSTYLELKLGMLAAYLIALFVVWRMAPSAWFSGRLRWPAAAIGVAFLGAIVVLRGQATPTLGRVVAAHRNFYGVLYVDEAAGRTPSERAFVLRHGRILHGLQYAAADRRREPTTYYDRRSGVGLALENFPRDGSMRVGAVGLGIGTLAAYGRQGDVFRFYEINPDAVKLAESHFSFVKDCPARVETVLGDARLSLEREPPQAFDVLALDAFSGDAIPTHLLTQEAFATWLAHLSPQGVLAVHVTNRHIDLHPLIGAMADCFGLKTARIDAPFDGEKQLFASSWLLLTRNAEFLSQPKIRNAIATEERQYARVRLWTDDFSNLLDVLR